MNIKYKLTYEDRWNIWEQIWTNNYASICEKVCCTISDEIEHQIRWRIIDRLEIEIKEKLLSES
jgi:hypothetical protein